MTFELVSDSWRRKSPSLAIEVFVTMVSPLGEVIVTMRVARYRSGSFVLKGGVEETIVSDGALSVCAGSV
jgi:hypothetical protein